MQERTDDLFALIRRDPEAANLILRIGLVAPVAIVLLLWLGGMVIPGVIVGGVTVVLIVLYGAVLAYLTGQVIHSVQQWRRGRRCTPATSSSKTRASTLRARRRPRHARTHRARRRRARLRRHHRA